MIDEKEINYYRTNIINKYITEVQTNLKKQEVVNLKKYRKSLRFNPNYKLCKKCGKHKPLSEFYKNPLKSKGVFDYCKECAKLMKKARKNHNKNVVKESTDYFKKFREKMFDILN